MVSIETITKHQEKTTTYTISKMSKLMNYDRPRLFLLDDMIDKDKFIDLFGEESLYYSYDGNSTILRGKTTIKEVLVSPDNKYIFSNIIDTSLYQMINEYFPRFDYRVSYIVSRIYCGKKGTGSHFHYHPQAINYLISGKKLWLIMPPTNKNQYYYNNFCKYCKTEIPPLEWIDENLPHIIKNTEKLIMFTQESGSCVYIPNGWYHFVANLTDTMGVTYSWKIE